jgi:hypothetical protein
VGGDRSAVFICSSIILNSIKSYAEFDVASAVRQIRNSKTNLISSFVGFFFININQMKYEREFQLKFLFYSA